VTIRKVYIGSIGPYLFDDTDDLDDGDGDFSGQKVEGIISDGRMIAPEFVGIPVIGISVADIDDPSSELNPLSASDVGALLAVYEVSAGANDPFTLYLWDTDAAVENVPYTVDGVDGTWVAVGGKYRSGDVFVEGNVNFSGDIGDHTHESYDPVNIVCNEDQVICHNNEVVLSL